MFGIKLPLETKLGYYLCVLNYLNLKMSQPHMRMSEIQYFNLINAFPECKIIDKYN